MEADVMAPVALPRSVSDFRVGGIVALGPIREGDGSAEYAGVGFVGEARNVHRVSVPDDSGPPASRIGDGPMAPGPFELLQRRP